jgi:hypothetical protein
MGMVKVRYLVAKRQKSRILYYWQPNKPLRDAGFLPRRLAERTNDLAEAIREAEALNRELDAWRAGQQPVPVQPSTIPWLVKLYRSDPLLTSCLRRSAAMTSVLPSSRHGRSARGTRRSERCSARA